MMLARVAMVLIRIYQLTLSRILPPVCRFEPSCSRYSMACFDRFGFWRGLWLTVVRLSKCQPFHPGGFDPPPEIEGKNPDPCCCCGEKKDDDVPCRVDLGDGSDHTDAPRRTGDGEAVTCGERVV